MLSIGDVAEELHGKAVGHPLEVAAHISGAGEEELHIPACGEDPGYGLHQEVGPFLVGEAPDEEDDGRERVDAVAFLHLARVDPGVIGIGIDSVRDDGDFPLGDVVEPHHLGLRRVRDGRDRFCDVAAVPLFSRYLLKLPPPAEVPAVPPVLGGVIREDGVSVTEDVHRLDEVPVVEVEDIERRSVAGAESVHEHVAHGPAVLDDVVAVRAAVVVVDAVDLLRVPGLSPREEVDFVPLPGELLGEVGRRRREPAYLERGAERLPAEECYLKRFHSASILSWTAAWSRVLSSIPRISFASFVSPITWSTHR